MRLVNALAALHSSPQFSINHALDPLANIVITVGATEAIASCILAMIDPGDHVVVIQPFYDSYGAAISLAGGAFI